MVAPIVGGALISGAASLLGGAMGRDSAKDATRANIRLQKEFAQHGIRWRVADAKAAGLHPLYALGAQLPSFSPVYQDDPMAGAVAQAGQNIGQAVAAQETREQRAQTLLSTQLLQKQLEESDARIGVLRSEEALNTQRMNQTAAFPSISGTNPDGSSIDFGSESDPYAIAGGSKPVSPEEAAGYFFQDNVTPKAPDMISPSSGDNSVAPSRNPMWYGFNVGAGRTLFLPGGSSGDPSEALESLSESKILLWITYAENVRRNGKEWADWFFERYFSQPMMDELKRLNPF